MVRSTIPMMFVDVCDRYAGATGKTCYARKVGGVWQHTTHDTLRDMVECFALGLLRLGITPGDRIGIVSEHRVEWATADFAIATIGAVDVPIFPTMTAKQQAWIFADCEATCVIVSNAFQLAKVMAERAAMPSLRTVIVMNDEPNLPGGVLPFSEVVRQGMTTTTPAERRAKCMAMAERCRPEDLLTIIYTSGTTGNPKGVMLSNGNITSNIAGALLTIPLADTDVLLSYLPVCHSYERMAGYYAAFAIGASTYIAESIESIADNLREVRPTIMTSVPRLFERIRMRVFAAAERRSRPQRALFQWALGIGERWLDTERPSAGLRMAYAIADRLVFSTIRVRTGGRLRFFLSGGAALHTDVARFFAMAGVRILEGYGLTETSPVIAVSRLGEEKIGSVGRPLANLEVRIAADGEILVRGPSVTVGYWRNPEATADAIDVDGWLHTGDIGVFDAEGRLAITDRKKHLLVSSGGKNIAPQPIEDLLVASPLIEQLLLIGNDREYCTALIVPDKEGGLAWARNQGLTFGTWDELRRSDRLQAAITADLQRRQRDLAKYERVRRFTLLDEPFTVENGMMTPTLKIRRREVERTYAAVIDAMYDDTSHGASRES